MIGCANTAAAAGSAAAAAVVAEAMAVKAAAALPSSASRDVARAALASPNAALSEAGLEAAITLGDEKAGEVLLERLKAQPVADWTESAIDALSRLRTKAAIEAFRTAMPSAPNSMKLKMLKAAKRIGGKDATRFLVEMSMAGEAEISRKASQLLRSR